MKRRASGNWTVEGFFKRHPNLRQYKDIKTRTVSTPGSGSHPNARYDFGTILFFPKWDELDKDTKDWAFAHELGHHAVDLYGFTNLGKAMDALGIDRWDVLSFPFGQMTNYEEAFADCFASYHTDGEVKKRYPVWAELVTLVKANKMPDNKHAKIAKNVALRYWNSKIAVPKKKDPRAIKAVAYIQNLCKDRSFLMSVLKQLPTAYDRPPHELLRYREPEELLHIQAVKARLNPNKDGYGFQIYGQLLIRGVPGDYFKYWTSEHQLIPPFVKAIHPRAVFGKPVIDRIEERSKTILTFEVTVGLPEGLMEEFARLAGYKG